MRIYYFDTERIRDKVLNFISKKYPKVVTAIRKERAVLIKAAGKIRISKKGKDQKPAVLTEKSEQNNTAQNNTEEVKTNDESALTVNPPIQFKDELVGLLVRYNMILINGTIIPNDAPAEIVLPHEYVRITSEGVFIKTADILECFKAKA